MNLKFQQPQSLTYSRTSTHTPLAAVIKNNARKVSPKDKSPQHLSFQIFTLYLFLTLKCFSIKGLSPTYDYLQHAHPIPFAHSSKAPSLLFFLILLYNHSLPKRFTINSELQNHLLRRALLRMNRFLIPRSPFFLSMQTIC